MDLMTFVRAERERVGGAVLILLGAAALIAGYVGVANAKYVADQLAYVVSGGLGGLFLLGCGATLFIMADLRDEWSKLDRVESAIRESGAGGPGTGSPAAAPVAALEEEPPTLAATTSPRATGRRRATASPQSVSFTATEGQAQAAAALRGTGAPAIARQSYSVLLAGAASSLLILVLAWHRAANVTDLKYSFGAASLGVAGVIVVAGAAAASTLWFKRGVTLRLRRLLAPWEFEIERQRVLATMPVASVGETYARGAAAAGPGRRSRETVVIGAALARYHRTGCPVLTSAGTTRTVTIARLPAGLQPCGICEAAPRAQP